MAGMHGVRGHHHDRQAAKENSGLRARPEKRPPSQKFLLVLLILLARDLRKVHPARAQTPLSRVHMSAISWDNQTLSKIPR